LADGERGALIGPDGAVNWLCAPTRHDDAVSASLIGGAGGCAVTPRGRWVPGGHHEEGTLIRRSRWITTDGVIECREALAFPGEPGRLVLLRQSHAVDGTAHVALAEHQQGNEVEAHRWFARNRGARGASGLYAEEFDIARRQLRGNLPPAFVHVLLLETAARLADAP